MSRIHSRLLPLSLAVLLVGCSGAVSRLTPQPDTASLMIRYGCPTCHVIPGVPGAVGKVGPSLEDLRQRSYLAGSLPNNPRNLQLWIMHPQQYRPGVAMPEMGLSARDAASIAAYLEHQQ